VALYNTGFGLLIAIPSMIFWRHFRALVDSFVIEMQQQAVRWSRFCTVNARPEGAADELSTRSRQ
jgi:biopolymer transport protein ExbB/TolQ